MRPYATNSPKAICRLLALTMIVDGHLAPRELKALHHSGLLRRLEVSDDMFDDTVGELCQDLLASSAEPDAGMVEIEPEVLERLLDDIDLPLLRICLLKCMLEIARADQVIDHRERRLLRRATHAWTQTEWLEEGVA
jgi:uncharacterized tellurite resistance protein B-like protein